MSPFRLTNPIVWALIFFFFLYTTSLEVEGSNLPTPLVLKIAKGRWMISFWELSACLFFVRAVFGTLSHLNESLFFKGFFFP